MSLLQDKTRLTRMLRLSTLGCQTTVHCSGLPLLLAPRWLSKKHLLDISGFQSALLSAVCLLNGWHGLDPDMMALYHTELHTIPDRINCAIPVRTVIQRPLVGIPTFQNRRLQSVLNAAAKARLKHRSSRHEHITHILLRDLHWFRSQERIDFKLAVLVYR